MPEQAGIFPNYTIAGFGAPASGGRWAAFLTQLGVLLEQIQWANAKRRLVCGLQKNLRCRTGSVSFQPALSAKTPPIAGLHSGKTEIRSRCTQVVPVSARKLEELGSHHGTHNVEAFIVLICVAAAIPKETGHRRGTATQQSPSENVASSAVAVCSCIRLECRHLSFSLMQLPCTIDLRASRCSRIAPSWTAYTIKARKSGVLNSRVANCKALPWVAGVHPKRRLLNAPGAHNRLGAPSNPRPYNER